MRGIVRTAGQRVAVSCARVFPLVFITVNRCRAALCCHVLWRQCRGLRSAQQLDAITSVCVCVYTGVLFAPRRQIPYIRYDEAPRRQIPYIRYAEARDRRLCTHWTTRPGTSLQTCLLHAAYDVLLIYYRERLVCLKKIDQSNYKTSVVTKLVFLTYKREKAMMLEKRLKKTFRRKIVTCARFGKCAKFACIRKNVNVYFLQWPDPQSRIHY